MSCDQALGKLSEKLNSRLLVQEEHGFQKGAQGAPLAAGAQKKPGLDRVKGSSLKPVRFELADGGRANKASFP